MARQYGSNTEISEKIKADQQAEQAESLEFWNKIFRYVSVAMILVGIMVLVLDILSYKKYIALTDGVVESITTKQNQLNELKLTESDENATVIESDVVSASAADAGKAVCKAQNDLTVASKADTGKSSLSNAHIEALERFRSYFSGISGKVNGTWCEYGVWEFNGTYEFAGSNIPVIWKCYDKSDASKVRLLAYVSADYNSSIGCFQNASLYYTTWYASALKRSEQYVTQPDEYELKQQQNERQNRVVDDPQSSFEDGNQDMSSGDTDTNSQEFYDSLATGDDYGFVSLEDSSDE